MSVACESYSAPVWLDLCDIDPRPACEVRVKQDEDAIKDYAEHWTDLPPIKVAVDATGKHWTEDGAHRHRSGLLAGKAQIRCVVRSVNDYVEAFQAACRANEENRAVRLTNADKRHRVEVALKNEVMSRWSNRLIAEHCGVSEGFVRNLRPESGAHDTQVVGKDGKSYSSPKRDRRSRNPREAESTNQTESSEPDRAPGDPEPQYGIGEVSPMIVLPNDNEPEGHTSEESRLRAHQPADTEDEKDEEEASPEMDLDAMWETEVKLIDSRFKAWPDDHKASYAFQLLSYAKLLIKRCPNVTDRSHEVFA